ncbi:beta strand repeat-containing protein [Terriglobus sp. 2YAB30_2]|uniref:beta strand repeat-containing protein n=2 Tax=unclassified Terriglobus TaxID=2628988 RepID=UPI003F96D159
MKTSIFRRAVVALSASFCVWFLTACSGGGGSNSSSNGGGNTVATPSVTSISPTKLAAGNAAVTLTVNGTNFTSTSSVQVGNVVVPTTYVSATQLTAAVPASLLVSGANLAIIVVNGGAASAGGTAVNLEVDNPSPVITSFTPSTFLTGTVSSVVSVIGTGFVPTTIIQVNGDNRSTTYVSGTQVNIVLSTADLAGAGTLTLTAVNGAPGGGNSAASSLSVNNPLPTISSLSPAAVPAGKTTATIVTVTGNNFISGTTVQVGTTAHTPTIVSGRQLTFPLSVAEQSIVGRLQVTAVNSAPGGGSSNPGSILVSTPTATPVLTALAPSAMIVGSPDSTITVTGSGFNTNCSVQWNDAALTTGILTSSSISAIVPASLLASIGTAAITVNCLTALVPLSNSLTVTIGNPPVPTLTALSPNYGPMNTATKITLTGTGFSTASTVSLNGTQLTTTYNSSTSLSVTVPASSLSLPGNYSFSVATPAPGGGTSSSLAFSAYIPLVNNSMVYNPADGLIYASIPGSVAAPLGNSVVSVNPATGAIGTPIFVGSEPNKLALTADGHYLWVGLDGSSAVRKVDLVAKTAGLKFSLPLVNSGIYNSPANAQALAALPGATDSVVVALSNSDLTTRVGLAIFDSGVMRTNTATNTIYDNSIFAIQTDGSKNEIYAGGGSAYNTFTYNSNGLTAKLVLSSITPASGSQDEMQLLSGKMFTNFGRVYDAEAGALLGSLYVTGQTVAQGATLADATLGKIFMVDYASGTGNSSGGANQIQIFKLSDYSSTGTTIPVNVPSLISSTSIYPTRLARWGGNGLVFRTPVGIYSLSSNAVADLSSVTADLNVVLSTGGSTATGSNTTFTARVKNNGPSTATDVVLAGQAPAIGTLVSATSTAGTCSTSNGITCSLGSMASGSTVTVTFTVLQTTAGSSTMAVQVSGNTDPDSTNNTATATATITGNDYNVAPVLSSISPAAIQTGTADTKLTVNGAGFSSGSTVMLGSTALATTFVSSSQLTATVPASSFASMGWAPVTVSTPAPGGGISSALPLTYFSVLTIGANHILYDPYSRQLMASVGSGSSSVAGNSIAAIQPDTASIGTPVSIGSQPTNMALSSDGQILYTILSGSQSIARYNMLTGQPDFTYTVPNSNFSGGIALRGVAVQPGTENTIALDIASFTGNAIYDFDPVHKTAAIRGQASGPYSGSCLSFLDAANMLAFDTDTSGFSLDHYTVTSSGFVYYNYSQYSESTLNHFGCFKLSGGLAFANGGGIADPSTKPATQIATLAGVSGGGFSNSQALEPDAPLHRAFYPATSSSNSSTVTGIAVFDLNTYQSVATLPLNMATIEGSTSYSPVDIIRWGQDGIAVLTSTGHIYLLRGAAIVPGLMTSGAAAASLASASSTTLTKGSGNVLLTLTGANFAPGVAVSWNGAYRTTKIVDSTHVTVAIPASDLAATGSGSLIATNPGAAASNSLSVTVQ